VHRLYDVLYNRKQNTTNSRGNEMNKKKKIAITIDGSEVWVNEGADVWTDKDLEVTNNNIKKRRKEINE
tara:strand:- start:1305 stop:1511 length:207 start_codon:yes stop_codon:yes gene_type:complete